MSNMEDRERRPEFFPKDMCDALMTKTKTLNTEYRRAPEENFYSADTAYFYCLCTMREHGPDENDVEPHSCIPGRKCFSSGTPS